MEQRWWKEAVAYQVYPMSFKDSNNDGIGDIGGIIEKLDYLSFLGIDVLWINPMYKSPKKDNGYDIADYYSIDKEFGTMSEFKELLKRAHDKNIKIIVDLVVNHTSNEHYWFIKSCKGRKSPYRNYYIWRDGKNLKTPPNNWGAHFGESAWTYDRKTGQYYLGIFSKFQPDLNWECNEMRNDLYKMMTWWTKKGIDGFRLDAVNFIAKEAGMPDNDPENSLAKGDSLFSTENFRTKPKFYDYLDEMHQEVFSKYDVMTIGECSKISINESIKAAPEGNGRLDMTFLFEHTDLFHSGNKNFYELKKIISRWQKGIFNKGWVGIEFNNHDQPRVVSCFGDDKKYREESAKLYSTFLLSLMGTPFIFQGEEIGMTNVEFKSLDEVRDISAMDYVKNQINKGKTEKEALEHISSYGRDNGRTPMQWNSGKNAGFSDGEPWMRVNHNYRQINVEDSVEDRGSILNYYRRMIRIRKKYKSLVYGEFQDLITENEKLYVFKRKLGNEEILVLLNLSGDILYEETLEEMLSKEDILLISNYTQGEKKCKIREYEARVYLKK